MAEILTPPLQSYRYAPKPNEFEQPNHRKGETRGTVARLDANGNDIWYRHLLPGQIFNVIQDSEGNLLVTGVSYTNSFPNDLTTSDNSTIHINDNATFDVNAIPQNDCGLYFNDAFRPRSLGYVTKLDPNGNILWTTFLNALPDNISVDPYVVDNPSLCHDIVEITGLPEPEYLVVGRSVDGISNNTKGVIYRIDTDGLRLDYLSYAPGMPGIPMGWPMVDFGYFTSIAYDEQSAKAFVSGFYEAAPYWQAVCLLIDPLTGLDPLWYHATGNSDPAIPGHSTSQHNYTTGGGFVNNAQTTKIVWPTLANYTDGNIFSGPSVASLLVHGFALDGSSTWSAPLDLGEVSAYDLQSDMVATDQHVAIVSTKAGKDPDQDIAGEFNSADLAYTGILGCVINDFGYVPEGDPAGWRDWANDPDELKYWNTDAYVAKIDPETGTVLWEKQWDADPGTDFECWPGDIRNQECMYKITEAPDGGLVVSGNTSHNFDDYYLVKLKPDCQALVQYYNLPLDQNGFHELQGNATWTNDLNIYGKIVVPSGVSLTIDNAASIHFADSKQLEHETQLIVKPGGKLFVRNNAILTSLDECPASMWDGAQIWGNYWEGQDPVNNSIQGFASVRSGAIIENARCGLLAARGFSDRPMSEYIRESTGAIIQASDAVFKNNRYDVVFRPYENISSTAQILPNRSYFIRCHFLTNSDLNEPGLYPVDHVGMAAVRGIPFQGCMFENTIIGTTYQMPFYQGVGIHAMNSSFTVTNDCSVIVPAPDPCPPQNITTSSFINLHRGILATTFDPSRTFVVSDASFTGTNFGIRMEGIQNAAIHRNSFQVPEPIISGLVGAVYGVYSDECTGYSIQENTFFTTQPTGLNRKVGLIIRDSGMLYNTFYNNTFNNLYTGSLVQGKNATVDGSTGLEIKCNDYGMEQPNNFDVGLTGNHVYIQGTQGSAVTDISDPAQLRNPAGNRFSLLHNGFVQEEDWYVYNTSTFVEYFHHQPLAGSRTRPDYRDLLHLNPNTQGVFWPNQRSLACPTRLPNAGAQVKREAAEQEHEAFEDSKTAYDSTKDDGDTYTLLGYVSDPGYSSTQVRNALQSVAPKVSAEVWRASFERNPTMNAWHITQALISNSPLQGEVLKMVDFYGLPTTYANMVYAAQTGEINILSLMQGEVALHGGLMAEALADLGRMAWLDTLQLGAALDSLLLVHDALPSDMGALTRSGVLAAQGEYLALESLADAESAINGSPELYALLKHYAIVQQISNWHDESAINMGWLEQLGTQRDVIGSAHANAWLHALGQELPEEIIILPEDGPKNLLSEQDKPNIKWETGLTLEVFPNPSNGPVHVVYEVPEGITNAELRMLDVHGREQHNARLGQGVGLVAILTSSLPAGVYFVELMLNGKGVAQSKLILQ
ncbi:MAG: T9SS type A sorting domain-containing protein [Bacteroidota bacterium]|nr:T9SS type A sorting domain-containing protein [Bacteroidota bacterium]